MRKPVKVLIVEDSEDDAKLALRALRQGGFEPAHRRVQTATALEAALAGEPWDAVISDFNMSGFTGLDALRIFRATDSDSPFILISGTVGEEIAVDAMKAGANDYIVKRNLPRLASVLERELKEAAMRADHRQAERRLRENEAQLRQAEQVAKLAHAISRPDGSFESWSDSLPALIGIQAARLPTGTREWLALLHPDDRSMFRDRSIEAGKNRNRVDVEYRLRRGDGAWISIRHVIEPLHEQADASGRTRWFNTVQDVSDQKRAEDDLRESEARFRSLSGISSDFYWESDAGHRLTTRASANTKLSAVSTFRQGAQIGERRWEIPYLSPDEAGWRAHRAVLDAHLPFRDFELSRRGTDGAERHISIGGDPMFDAAGAFKGYRGVGTDITERRRAELRIRRLNRVYAVLSGINGAIVRIHDRDELFREVCRLAVSEGGFTHARVVDLDAEGKARFSTSTGGGSGLFRQIVDEYNSDPERFENLLALALRSGEPMISNDVANDARMPNREALTKDGTFAVAVLPFTVERRVAGVVVLRAKESGLFDDAELQLLLEVVSNLSFALEHIGKEAKVLRLTRVYAVLSGINALIVRVRGRDELFAAACRIAVEQGGFKLAWIGVVDRSAMKIVPVVAAGAEPGFLETIQDYFARREDQLLGSTLSARAVRDGKAVVSNDVQNDSDVVFREGHAKRGSRSMAILPLKAADDVLGLLVLYSVEAGLFDEQEIELLNGLAGDIGLAIDNIGKRERLDYLAYYDDLTGLANRALFLERVAQYMRGAGGAGHKLGVFLMDLERFKNINDSLGRPAGDALLHQVAQWLTRSLGDANLLARVGADLFAVVLPHVRQEGNVRHLLEKMMADFLEHSFQLKDAVFRVNIKVGAALFPDDGGDAEALFRNAEAALKKAKAKGDRYAFYKPKMTEAVAGKLTLENQLRQAFDREEFVLHYQPKVSVEGGKLTGAEALIRWNDPRTGLVPPGRFIPVLEEIGLISEVGRWALRQALADYLRWRAAGLPSVRIAVNVSPLQLRNRGFSDEIRQILAADPNAAGGLELEITESLIMENVKHSIATLKAIRDLGVTIAIDDFGTGFSSLSYLARLPVDTLKIDRSFVNEMTVAPQGLGLVSTIISLAHSLSLKVVAEGVETAEQSRLLRLLRCDEMQGFLFSKPVPADIFEATSLVLPSAA